MTSSAFWDQEAAARRDTSQLLEKMHDVAGGRKGMSNWGEKTDGWRKEFAANLAAGRVRRCQHLSSPNSAVINAWQLDYIRCTPCNQLAELSGATYSDDDLCDGCQRRVGKAEVTAVASQAGPLVFIGGLCQDCLAIEHATGGDLE